MSDNGVTYYGFLLSGGDNRADPINDAGVIAGWFASENPPGTHGFRLRDSGYRAVTPAHIRDAEIFGVSGAGKLVGIVFDQNSYHNFSLFHGQYQQLHIPGTQMAAVLGIDALGDTLVGGYTLSGENVGFYYREATLQTLEFPSSTETVADGVNNSGTTVGWFLENGLQHGFTWTPPADAAKK